MTANAWTCTFVPMDAIAENLRERRLELGLSQERLAAKAELTLRTVSKYELGNSKRPDLITLEALAGALGCTLQELLAERA